MRSVDLFRRTESAAEFHARAKNREEVARYGRSGDNFRFGLGLQRYVIAGIQRHRREGLVLLLPIPEIGHGDSPGSALRRLQAAQKQGPIRVHALKWPEHPAIDEAEQTGSAGGTERQRQDRESAKSRSFPQ